MTYVIAEPCIAVKDRACIEECPVGCVYEGERMLYIRPANASTRRPRDRLPGRGIFYEDDVHGRPASSPPKRPDFPAARLARRRQGRPGAPRHRLCRQLLHRGVTRPCPGQVSPDCAPLSLRRLPLHNRATTTKLGPRPCREPTPIPPIASQRAQPSLGTGDHHALPDGGPAHTRRCRPAGRDPLVPARTR